MFNPAAEVKVVRLQLERQRGTDKEVSPWMNILSWGEQGKRFVHCLELDIVADGETEGKALHSLAELIMSQIEFAEENNIEIFHPAPREYWEKLYQIHTNYVKQRLLDNPPKSVKEVLRGLEPVHA